VNRLGHARAWALLLVVGFCSATAIAGDELDKRLAQADVRMARRFASLALKADKAKQRASARRLYERVMQLDPGNTIAQGKLGFKKRSGSWVRSSDDSVEVNSRKDSDLSRVAKLREERKKLEALRAREILKVAAKYGTPETARPHLVALLRFAPRDAAVHVALGHEKIGDVYVRPELTDFVRSMPQRLAAWKKCAEPAEAVNTRQSVTIPGVNGTRTLFKVGGRQVTTGLKLDQTIFTARRTECPHNLLRELFGANVLRWDPPRVYFLIIVQYKAYVESRVSDEKERARRLRTPTFIEESLVVKRIGSSLNQALDGYAHGVLFRSMTRIVSPLMSPDNWDTNRYPWFKEGVAVLGTLELLGSASTWFFSRGESAGKAEPSLPLPDPLTKASSITYVREQYYDGTLPPMEEVFGNSLNNLDRIRALYASTLIRFLAVYDPTGFRAFPAALREQKKGSQVECTKRALEQAFGKNPKELLRLWRAYLLELT